MSYHKEFIIVLRILTNYKTKIAHNNVLRPLALGNVSAQARSGCSVSPDPNLPAN